MPVMRERKSVRAASFLDRGDGTAIRGCPGTRRARPDDATKIGHRDRIPFLGQPVIQIPAGAVQLIVEGVVESVWDYPRPPRVEPSSRRITVEIAGVTVADSTAALRVLETSHPPVYYLSRADVAVEHLIPSSRRTVCEFKGVASYWHLEVGGKASADAAWSYENPAPGYEALAGRLAFYPGRVLACYVDDELVRAQPGDFYGGWITSDVTGPFKGEATYRPR